MDVTHGGYGLNGWQWMFLLEGLPVILLGLFSIKAIVERPDDAAWLTHSEKALVRRELAQESQDKKTSLLPALREPTLWILFATSFLYNLGNYGLVFWMPSMIKSIGGHDRDRTCEPNHFLAFVALIALQRTVGG